MLRVVSALALAGAASAAPPVRSALFSSVPTDPSCADECDTSAVAFPVPDMAEMNKVFDQLTVAEQLTIEDMMRPFGVSFTAYEKCITTDCSTIAKLQLEKPPKAEVLAYMAGTGPKPKRIASFWWLRANLSPRVAELHTVELPITASTTPTLVRSVPWERRPFVTWEDPPLNKRNDILEPLLPIFDDMLSKIVPSPTMLAKLEAAGQTFSPTVRFGGGGHNVPGSVPGRLMYFGRLDVRAGAGPHYYKEGPLQYTMAYTWETDELEVFDIVICPGAGNPVFNTVQEVLDSYNAGTLILCEVDGDFYGDTKAHMDPEEPYYIPESMAARVEPRVIMPEGQRFAVSGRTVSWMGWDFHADINGIQGMHISNLRFQGERLAYELHAVEFSAVYSGASTRKDIYYSDGGYEMGNCATTLREGLQCPHGSVFLYNLGYDDTYVWGNALAADQERPTMCIFEAPDNEALFQHAKEYYEGLPGSSLYVRNVLTVGNYDYTQTFRVSLDGSFHLSKKLSGYGVGAYVLPGAESSKALAEYFGSFISKSSLGALHTHSASTKVDLDIAGVENSFKIKAPAYGNLANLLENAGLNPEEFAYQSPGSYYFKSTPVATEGMWDNDGDDVWTPPEACIAAKASDSFVVYSEATTDVGNKRGYKVEIPSSPPLMLPEGNPYLHLQNFTKCDMAVTAYNVADKHAVTQSVFGDIYPNPAAPGNDISHFFDGQSLENTDLVLYIHQTKHHYVIGEDVPVPTTMGKEISFEPYNYFTDGIGPFKHLPKAMYRYAQGPEGIANAVRPATTPVEQCTITTV